MSLLFHQNNELSTPPYRSFLIEFLIISYILTDLQTQKQRHTDRDKEIVKHTYRTTDTQTQLLKNTNPQRHSKQDSKKNIHSHSVRETQKTETHTHTQRDREI